MTSERLASRESAGETKLAEVHEAMPAIIAVLDARGIMLSLSRECAAKFGEASTRLVGRSILSLAHQDDRDRLAATLAEALRHRNRVAYCEFRVWRHRKPPALLSASVRAASPGEGPSVLLAACSDITDRVYLERQLEQRRGELSEMAGRLLIAEDGERRRIAREMHDGIGHTLALARFHLDSIERDGLPQAALEAIGRVHRLLQESIDSVRSLTFALNAPLLHEQGLDAAVEDLGQSLSTGADFEFALSSRPREQRLSEVGRITLYRVIRELLVNVIKHARARHVRVSIGAAAGTLHIAVIDDGIGLQDLESARTGSGLQSIRETLSMLEGELSIGAGRTGGTQVLVSVPFRRVGADVAG